GARMHERDREPKLARDEVDEPQAEGDDQAVRCFVPRLRSLPFGVAACTGAPLAVAEPGTRVTDPLRLVAISSPRRCGLRLPSSYLAPVGCGSRNSFRAPDGRPSRNSVRAPNGRGRSVVVCPTLIALRSA